MSLWSNWWNTPAQAQQQPVNGAIAQGGQHMGCSCSACVTSGLSAGASSGAQFGIAGAGHSGNVTITTGTTFQWGGAPLTAEEQKELEELKLQHAQIIKVAKLTEFKKLVPELRQFVVNAITWKENLDKINQTQTDKDPRQIELETKQQGNTLYGSLGTSGIQWTTLGMGSSYNPFFAHVPIPDGMTSEDLMQAHLEATLEEQMLEKDEVNT